MSRMHDSGRPVSETGGQRASGPSQNAMLSAGNGAVTRMLSVQRLEQDLPYVGALASYLNPFNQAARLVFDDLTSAQEGLLTGIFGSSLATSVIRINYNSAVGAAGGIHRTTGNIINCPGSSISDNTLVHEAAHVWQHQNGVPFMYAVSALRSQALAAIITGNRGAAYDYTTLEKYRVPWRYWNAEQQASWIENNRKLPDGWWLDAIEPDPPGDLGLDVPFG